VVRFQDARLLDWVPPPANSSVPTPAISPLVPLSVIPRADCRPATQECNESVPRQAEIVELRFFGGLSVEETAQALAISEKTVKRDWSMARAWLRGELEQAASC
jgi:DNA-directed RNA polymerase specialized sigma24 family protein